MQAQDYGLHTGPFHNEHRNPPAPFNPLADANAAARYQAVTDSLVADDYYSNHTREECKAEWARRYDVLKATTIPFVSAQEVYRANA